MKKIITLFKNTYSRWMKNEPFQESAIITYYTLFSLPSFFVIIITVAGYFFGKSEVQGQIIGNLGEIVGLETAESLEKIILNVSFEEKTTLALIISIGVMVFGATGAFFQLKKTMNKIWSVREKKANIIMMILDRLLSLGLILSIGFMMVASLIITTLVAALGDYIKLYAPTISSFALNAFNFLFSYIFIWFLITLIFKLLPDVKLRWRSTFVGASLTTILFLIAEYGLGVYFSQSNPASVFGSASSIILLMLWINYTCLILFFGAEFTFQYALFRNEKVEPNRYSEPAFIQELRELKDQKIYTEKQKKLLERIDGELEDL